jgi:hypothetical protein
MPFGKKRWLVKHLPGFAPVRRVMKRRMKWDHVLCPICLNLNKTEHHICLCQSHQIHLQWIQLAEKCMVALNKAGTDPEIITVIWQRLVSFCSRTAHRFSTLSARTSRTIRTAVRDQESIGWQRFLCSRFSKQWINAAQAGT